MHERDDLEKLCRGILGKIPADEAELSIGERRVGATRFSNNAISQNMDESTRHVRLRVVKGGRQGVASCNSFDAGALDTLVSRALTAAAHSDPDKELLPMLDKQPAYQASDAYNEDTVNTTPRKRAEKILEQLALCRQHGLEGAGLFTTGGRSNVYANSRGVFAYHRSSVASLTMSAFAEDGKVEGYADAIDHNVNSLSARRVGSTAMEKAMKGRGPKPVEPGKYDVVLERTALSDVVLFLSWLGFGTQAHVEQRSGLSGKLGQKIFSDSLTVLSDPYDPRFEGEPFDGEGFATQRLTMIDKGVFRELPHDRRSAKALGAANTGHGCEQPSTHGPSADCIVIKEGTATLDKLIESTERGLLITQFHYTNTVDPMALTITGMTRGGVWLIEHGKIKHPVTNMRFTESLVRAFNNIDGIGNIAEPCAGGLFGTGGILPAMKIRDFNFSSATSF